MPTCAVADCHGRVHARGWCSVHYGRWRHNGDPASVRKPWRPAGQILASRPDGYRSVARTRPLAFLHRLIAESALGRPLPPTARVHHVDGNPSNNVHGNLVICENERYHKLLHHRQRARRECGHADWQKCSLCGRWDPAPALYISPSGRTIAHRPCYAAYRYARRHGVAQ